MNVSFVPFLQSHRSSLLVLLDANIPAAFAAKERPVFEAFLDGAEGHYWAALEAGDALAAFGLSDESPGRGRIRWLMAHPAQHRQGLGRTMIAAVRSEAVKRNISLIDIAASHVSEGFYRRFGGETIRRTEDGWGPGMHRVDMLWRPWPGHGSQGPSPRTEPAR